MRCIVFAQEHRMNTVQQSAWEDAKDWDPEPLPPPPHAKLAPRPQLHWLLLGSECSVRLRPPATVTPRLVDPRTALLDPPQRRRRCSEADAAFKPSRPTTTKLPSNALSFPSKRHFPFHPVRIDPVVEARTRGAALV